MNSLRRHRRASVVRSRSGVSAVFTVLVMVAIAGMVSFGVDLGRVYVAKGELQTAADAAARAAGAKIGKGASAVRAEAIDAADDNTCDGTAVVLVNSDVEFGNWNSNTRTFTPVSGSGESSAQAVRVTARREASRGTGVPLLFAKLVGRGSLDIHASAVAVGPTAAGVSGFIGLDSVTFHNNTFVASYNSQTQPKPTQIGSFDNAQIGTNGTITFKQHSLILGDIILGPSGTVTGSKTVTGDVETLTSVITAPPSPPWNPGTNPGGIPHNYSVSKDTTLPGGTYWFTSLTINADLVFSGKATVYVNGDVTIDGSIIADDFNPSNLKIYQLGAHTFGDAKSNGAVIVAQVEAPQSDLVFKNNIAFYGNGVFKTIQAKNNSIFFYDEQLGSAGSGQKLALVR